MQEHVGLQRLHLHEKEARWSGVDAGHGARIYSIYWMVRAVGGKFSVLLFFLCHAFGTRKNVALRLITEGLFDAYDRAGSFYLAVAQKRKHFCCKDNNN